jgi:Holliday junction resolvasome RuvABC endonuclease subunit
LGDEIYFVLKGDNQLHHTAIQSIQEFQFITIQRDTIKFSEVAKLKFRNKGVGKYVKSTLIGSAGLTALHFALKKPFGNKNPQAVNGLAYAAGAGLVSTAFMLVTTRSKMKLTGFKRLKYIGYDSPLYR